MSIENKTNELKLTSGQIAEMQKANSGRYNYLKRRVSASKKITCARLIELLEDDTVKKILELPNENSGDPKKADRKEMNFEINSGNVSVSYWKMRVTLGDVVIESGSIINAPREYSMYRIKSAEERGEFGLSLTLTEEKGNYVKFIRLFADFVLREIKANHSKYKIDSYEERVADGALIIRKPYKTTKTDKKTKKYSKLDYPIASVNLKVYNKTESIDIKNYNEDEIKSNPLKKFTEYKIINKVKKAIVKTRTSRFFVEEAYHRSEEEISEILKEYKKKGRSLIGKNGKQKQFNKGRRDVTHLCLESNIHNYFVRSGILGLSFYVPTLTFSAAGMSLKADAAMLIFKADPEKEHVVEEDSDDDEFDNFVVDTAKPKIKTNEYEEQLSEIKEQVEQEEQEEENSNGIEVDEKDKANAESIENTFDNMTTVDKDGIEDMNQ